MSSNPIAHQRLANQRITHSSFATPQQVVAWLGALQGQDYAGSKWAIGLRLPGSTDATVEDAIANRQIVRTWAVRGTLHFVAAADLRWLLTVTAPIALVGAARRFRELELDEATLAQSNRLLATAVQDGQPHSRTALFALLEAAGLTTAGQRGIYMLLRASLDGLLYQSVAQRNVATFCALDETIPRNPFTTRDEALAELAHRYFTSHGPATQQDFAHWSGLPAADVRIGLDAVKSQLIQAQHAGTLYWQADQPHPPMDETQIHLLPGFDEYLLGYRDRSAVLEPQYANRIVPGGNGIFYATIVNNGHVVGTWKRTFKKGAVVMTQQPFTALTAIQQTAFVTAAQRYGDFLGVPVVVDL